MTLNSSVMINSQKISELMFNTISVSDIPAANTMSFARSLFNLFNDDVFQLTVGQRDLLWNLTNKVDNDNLDTFINILVDNDPIVNVEMKGGFIGKMKIPIGYSPGFYYENDYVTFLDSVSGNLLIYKSNSNTSETPGSSSNWVAQIFSSTNQYLIGQQISHENRILQSLVNFPVGGAPFNNADWEVIATKYDTGTAYKYGDLIVRHEVGTSGPPVLFKCIGNTSGNFNDDFWLRDLQVVSDQRYEFKENLNWTADIPEVQSPPSGNVNEALYTRLRYAFAGIEWAPSSNQINIQIEAYASPLISRLDNPARSNDVPRINNNTIFVQNPSSNAFINHTVDGVIPSYNQVLTALRTWGILKAMMQRVQEKADTYSDPEVGIKIAAKIALVLNGASVKTTKSVSDPSVANLFLTETDFDLIKL